MTRRLVTPPTFSQCKHLQREDTCARCARAELPGLIERLQEAVSAGRSTGSFASAGGGGGGGTPSWEPINVAAVALLQDINRKRWTDANVINFRQRARVILGDAFAAYTPLVRTSDDEKQRGKPVPCPRRRGPEATPCNGVLQVHREPDPRSIDHAKPTVVRCTADANHEWFIQGGGFLRLRVELDAIGHVHLELSDIA